jgi:hypothetical protein
MHRRWELVKKKNRGNVTNVVKTKLKLVEQMLLEQMLLEQMLLEQMFL